MRKLNYFSRHHETQYKTTDREPTKVCGGYERECGVLLYIDARGESVKETRNSCGGKNVTITYAFNRRRSEDEGKMIKVWLDLLNILVHEGLAVAHLI